MRGCAVSDLEVSTANAGARAKGFLFLDLDKLVSRTGLFYSMQNLVAEYILRENYFVSENMAKAIKEGSDTSQCRGCGRGRGRTAQRRTAVSS